MFTSGSPDFAAYARNLRRGQLAERLERSLEAMAASRPQRDIFDLLFGGDLAARHLVGVSPEVRGPTTRDQNGNSRSRP
jgi:hypothetical protein